MGNGAVAGFKYFDLKEKTRITVTTRGAGGVLQVSTEMNGKPVASVSLSGEKDWACASVVAELPKGVHALWFTYEGAGKIDFLAFGLEPVL